MQTNKSKSEKTINRLFCFWNKPINRVFNNFFFWLALFIEANSQGQNPVKQSLHLSSGLKKCDSFDGSLNLINIINKHKKIRHTSLNM